MNILVIISVVLLFVTMTLIAFTARHVFKMRKEFNKEWRKNKWQV